MTHAITSLESVQATASVLAPAGDAHDQLAAARQHIAHSAFCAQIVPAQVTFISSSSNMAPIATRKAALVRFRAKKARSHFAPKVRFGVLFRINELSACAEPSRMRCTFPGPTQ